MHKAVYAAHVALIALFWPIRADAYLNPDSGSLLLQVLLGGAAGVAIALKLVWHRVTALFAKDVRNPEAEQ